MEEQSKGGESQLLFFGSNAAQGIREVNSLPHLLLSPWKNSLSDIHKTNFSRSTQQWISTKIYHNELILGQVQFWLQLRYF